MLGRLPFTLRQLDLFSSLCVTRSFGMTAEQFGISQASVSSQVKSLEHQLGFSLFERRPGKRPLLTEAGLAFLTDLGAFADAAQALARHRRARIEEKAQRAFYRVLVGQGLMDNYIRSRLDQFFADNPEVELEFEARPPGDKLARDLREGRYDFALIHRRADKPVELWWQQLAQVRGGIYGLVDFAAGQELPLTAEFVSTLPFILPTVTTAPEVDMLQYLERHGLRPQRVVGQTQFYDVMAAMLERGIGVASFADPILPVTMRDKVVLLHPLENWGLLWFAKSPETDSAGEAVKEFLWDCVPRNPQYLTVEKYI